MSNRALFPLLSLVATAIYLWGFGFGYLAFHHSPEPVRAKIDPSTYNVIVAARYACGQVWIEIKPDGSQEVLARCPRQP